MVKNNKVTKETGSNHQVVFYTEGRCVWGDDEISLGSVPFSSFFLF